MFYQKSLYIFFLVLALNLSFFSTNKVIANAFLIDEIEISEKLENNFNKDILINKGFEKAFKELMVKLIQSKDLDKIDQDRWIICANIDSANLPSRVYAGEELIKKYDLDNKPKNIHKVPFVFRRDAINDQNLNFKFDNDDSHFLIKNVRYIVEDDDQKIKLIQNNLAVGVLVENYDEVSKSSSIRQVKGISVKTFHDRQTIIVSKYLKDRTKIVRFLKDQVGKYMSIVFNNGGMKY